MLRQFLDQLRRASRDRADHLRIDEAQHQNIIRIAEHLLQIGTRRRAGRIATEISAPERTLRLERVALDWREGFFFQWLAPLR